MRLAEEEMEGGVLPVPAAPVAVGEAVLPTVPLPLALRLPLALPVAVSPPTPAPGPPPGPREPLADTVEDWHTELLPLPLPPPPAPVPLLLTLKLVVPAALPLPLPLPQLLPLLPALPLGRPTLGEALAVLLALPAVTVPDHTGERLSWGLPEAPALRLAPPGPPLPLGLSETLAQEDTEGEGQALALGVVLALE